MMEFDRSAFKPNSRWAAIQLGGERIAVELDGKGGIESAVSQDWQFQSPGDFQGTWLGENEVFGNKFSR